MSGNETINLKASEVMKRVTFIKVHSKMILKIDMSGLEQQEHFVKVVNYVISMVDRMLKNSVLGLVDMRDLNVSEECMSLLAKMFKSVVRKFIVSAILVDEKKSTSIGMLIAGNYNVSLLQRFTDEELATKWLLSR